jgi:hypothetical protein
MRIRKAAAFCAAGILAFGSPLSAQAASTLSVSRDSEVSRASADTTNPNDLFGASPILYVAGLLVLTIVMLKLLDNNSDAEPQSP